MHAKHNTLAQLALVLLLSACSNPGPTTHQQATPNNAARRPCQGDSCSTSINASSNNRSNAASTSTTHNAQAPACPKTFQAYLQHFTEHSACRALDQDGDHIPDPLDACPDRAEVINNIDDDDGCPDVGASLIKRTAKKIELLQPIEFDIDKAKIKPQSYPVLDQVVTMLRHDPTVSLRVEAHLGAPVEYVYSRKLSQNRARAVTYYLVSKGIERNRLRALGYEGERPIASPKHDPDAFQKNKRIELVILEKNER